MKIRTQLILSTAALILVIAIFGASMIVTSRQVSQMDQQRELAARIQLDAYMLDQLTNDYLLNQGDRQEIQWEAQYADLSQDLDGLAPSGPEQESLVAGIRSDQQHLHDIFREVSSSSRSAGTVPDTAFIATSWSRMEVESQGVISATSRLSTLIGTETGRVRQVQTLLLSALVGIILAILLVNYLLVYRRLTTAVTALRQGAETIGSGDLRYQIPEQGSDEFRDLAASFNAMALNRKRAEEGLRDRELQLHNVIDSLPSAMVYTVRLWPGGRREFTFISGAVTALHNCTPEEAMADASRIYRTFAEEEAPALREEEEQAADNGGIFTRVIRLKSPDTLPRWVYAMSRPRPRLDDGSILYDGVELEITDLRRTEQALQEKTSDLEAAYEEISATDAELRANYEEIAKNERELRESEARLRQYFDAGLFGVITWTADGRIEDANATFLSMTGYTRDDLENGRIDWAAMTPPEYRAQDEASLAELRAEGRNRDPFEKEYFRKNGSRVPVLIAGAMLDEKRTRGVAFVLDITNLREARVRLAAEKERHRELFESVSVGILRSTREDGGRIIDANPAAIRIFGAADREELLAVRSRDLFLDPGERQRIVDEIGRNGFVKDLEVRYHTLRGRPFWARVSAVSRQAPDGSVYFDTNLEDITERKAAEDALREKTTDLEAAYEEITASEEELRENYDELVKGEQALRESEARYRELFNNIPVGISRSTPGPQGNILVANPAVLRIFEAGSAEELFAMSPDSLYVTREDRQKFTEEMLRNGIVTGFEVQFRSCKGRPFWGRMSSKRGIAADGSVFFDNIVEDISERKAAEEAFRESEERYRILYETMVQGVVYQDADGSIIAMNPAAIRILGKTPEEFLGQTSVSVEHDTIREDGTRFPGGEHPAMIALRTGAIVTGTVMGVYNPLEGQYRWIEIDAVPVPRPGETQAYRVFTVFTDITERRKVRDALNESEKQYRLIAENTGDVIWLLDPAQQRFTYVSPSVEKLRGYTQKEVLGQTMEMVLTPASYTAVQQELPGRIARFLAGDESQRTMVHEVDQTCRDGSVVPTEVVTTLLTDEQGKLTQILGVTRSITERRKADAALRKSRAQLHAALESMTDAVFISDVNGTFVEFNKAFATFHKFADKAACKKTLAEYPDFLEVSFPDGTIAPLDMWAVPRALRGEVVLNAEYRLRRKDTGEAWIGSYSFAPIRDRDGTITGSVVVGRDITERVRAEEEILMSRARLSQAMDLAHLVNWEYDPPTGTFTFNDRFYALYGTTAEREGGYRMTAGEYALRFVHPADRHMVAEHAAKAQDPDMPEAITRVEHRIIRRDGQTRTLAVQFGFVRDEAGRVIRSAGASQDITEQVEAREALKESEERLRTFITQAPAALAMFDTGMRYLAVSQRWMTDYHLGEKDLVGLSHYEVFPEITDEIRDVHRRCLAGEILSSEGTKFFRGDGSFQWTAWQARPWFMFGNRIGGIIIYSVDISDRKDAEDALKADLDAAKLLQTIGTLFINEENMLTVFSRIVDAAIAITGADFGNIQLVDPATSELRIMAHHGLPDGWLDFWASEGRGKGACDAARKVGERVIVEDVETSPVFAGSPALEIQRRAGIRAVLSTPMVSRSGEFLGIFSTHYRKPHRPDERQLRLLDLLSRQAADIIERSRSEAAVRESEEKFRLVVETAPESIFIQTRGKFAYLNPAALRLFGAETPDQLIGRPVMEMFHPDFHEIVRERIRALNEDQKPMRRLEQVYLRCDGTPVPVEVSAVPFLYEGDHGALVFVSDITERKAAEAALKESEERFRQFFEKNYTVMLIIDPANGRILDANPAAAAFYGYSREKLCAMRVPDINTLPPGEIAGILTHVRDGQMHVFEVPHRRADGSDRLVEIFATPVITGSKPLLFAIIHDITERRSAENALIESEERYRSLFTNMQEGLAYCHMIYDPDGRPADFVYLAVNDAFDRIIGAGTVLNRPVTEVFPGIREAFPQLFEIYGRVARSGEPETFDVEFTPVGKWLHISVYSPGEEHFVAIFTDITERKMAEEALKESEERYHAIFDNTSVGIVVVDVATEQFHFANTAICTMLGYTPAEMTLMHVRDIHPPKDHARVMAEFSAIVSGEKGMAPEIPVLQKDGNIRYMDITSAALVMGGKRYFAGFFIDVTERLKAEAAFRESEQRLRLAQDAANAGTWEWDLITNENYWSEKTLQLYGLDRVSVQPAYDQWLASIHPEDREAAARAVTDAAKSGTPIHAEWRVNLPAGRPEQWLMSRGQPVKDAAGTVVKYRGIVIDITERKHAEKEREAMIRDLEEKNAELERFTYTISHDLKSPLITILGYAGLLEEEIGNGETDDMPATLRRITSAAKKMEQLLADVLQLSRIGRIVAPPERTPFTAIAQEAADLVAIPLKQRQVRMEIALDMPEVYVDHGRIREVMVNLIENAVKYMGSQEHPRIQIGVTRIDDKPVFFVRDNGIGINPAYLGRIFNLFEKLDPSSPGTGVGLTIVKRIIEIHGGKIWAESRGEGTGTTIRFTLPLIDAPKTHATSSESKGDSSD